MFSPFCTWAVRQGRHSTRSNVRKTSSLFRISLYDKQNRIPPVASILPPRLNFIEMIWPAERENEIFGKPASLEEAFL